LNEATKFQGRRHAACRLEREMKEAERNVREYLAKIGKRDGLASRRGLTRSHAKQMIAIREAKHGAIRASALFGRLQNSRRVRWLERQF
jgi:hypothetical protein